jgi:hypothetical protein
VRWNNYLSPSANSVLRSHQVSISKKDGVSSDCQRLRGGSSWRRAAPAKLVNAVLHSNLFSHPENSSSFNAGKTFMGKSSWSQTQHLSGGTCTNPGCGRPCGLLSSYPPDVQRKVAGGVWAHPHRCVDCIQASSLLRFSTSPHAANSVL